MLEKSTRRLIKESLISIYQVMPEAIEFPVYYLPMSNDHITVAKSVRVLHRTRQIPWPQADCILLSDDLHEQLLSEALDKRSVAGVARSKRNAESVRTQMRQHLGDDDRFLYSTAEDLLVVHTMANDHEINVRRHSEPMVRVQAKFAYDPVHSAHHLFEQLKTKFDRPVSEDVVRNRLIDFFTWSADPDSQEMWTAIQGARHDTDDPRTMRLSTGGWILSILANLVVPCGYVVRSTFQEGFGPPSVRKKTKGKSVLSVVHYNRLYASVHERCTGYHVEPHGRDGHRRHFWKRAGIDRHTLPADPHDRLQLILQHQVESIYIAPTWVGPKVIHDGDVQHEVLSGAMDICTGTACPESEVSHAES